MVEKNKKKEKEKSKSYVISLRLTPKEMEKLEVIREYIELYELIKGKGNVSRSDAIRYILEWFFRMLKEQIKAKRST